MDLLWAKQAQCLAQDVSRASEGSTRPFIVAIDGRSGSGKSTLAAQMAKLLDAAILPGDDFFAGGTEILDDPPQRLAELCIDWREQREVLEALRSGQPIRYFPFDWEAFDGSRSPKDRIVETRPVILFEGVYSARPELRDLVDCFILVEVSEEQRMRQLLEREGEIGAWEKQWHLAEDWYFATLAPRRNFDAIASAHEATG